MRFTAFSDRASGMKHEDNMSRKDKIETIRYINKAEGKNAAMKFWLISCPNISRKVFEECCK